MPKPTYDQLLEMVEHYEFTLARIADKPRESRELVAHGGFVRETPEDAYKKCGRIAFMALRMFIPDIGESDLKKMDLAGRKARGLEIEVPQVAQKSPAKKAVGKARGTRPKRSRAGIS